MGVPLEQRRVCLGSTAVSESIVPGQYLEFFNPGSIESWLSATSELDEPHLGLSGFQSRMLCRLIYGAMLRERWGGRRDGLLEVFDSAFREGEGFPGLAEIMKIAALLQGRRSVALRDSIVYAGDLRATKSILYAQENLVPELMADLTQSLSNGGVECRGFNLACCVLLQILMIHPLTDANGRLARHLTIRIMARHQGYSSSAIVIGIQRWRRDWFNAAALRARDAGLIDFVSACIEQASNMRSLLVEHSPSFSCIRKWEPAPQAKESLEDDQVMRELFAFERVDMDDIQRILACSRSKARGVLLRLAEQLEFIEIQGDCLYAGRAGVEIRSLFAT